MLTIYRAIKKRSAEISKLQREAATLRTRVELMESGTALGASTGSELLAAQLDAMRAKLASAERRYERLKDVATLLLP